jgi:hypothetical protein
MGSASGDDMTTYGKAHPGRFGAILGIGLAVALVSVLEPGVWALMLLGVGTIATMARGRRRSSRTHWRRSVAA